MKVRLRASTSDETPDKVQFENDFEWKRFNAPKIGTEMPISTAQGIVNGVVSHVDEASRTISLDLVNCLARQGRYMLAPEGWKEISDSQPE